MDTFFDLAIRFVLLPIMGLCGAALIFLVGAILLTVFVRHVWQPLVRSLHFAYQVVEHTDKLDDREKHYRVRKCLRSGDTVLLSLWYRKSPPDKSGKRHSWEFLSADAAEDYIKSLRFHVKRSPKPKKQRNRVVSTIKA